MTSTAGTGTEIADVVDAPTGDAASGSGGASPVLSLTGISKRFGPVQANADITIECLAGRDPRPARRERVRQVHVAEHRQRQPRARQRHGRDRRRAASVGVAAGRHATRARHGVSAPHRGRRPDRRGEPLPRRSRPRPARLSPHVPVGDREDPSVRARHRRHRPDREPLRRRAADARGRVGAAPPAEGAAARRADHRPRPRRRPAPACADPQPRRQRDGRRVRQPPPSRGARRRQPHHGAARRRQSRHATPRPRCRNPRSWR